MKMMLIPIQFLLLISVSIPVDGYYILTKNEDIKIAGLFNVHLKGNSGTGYWANCGMIDPEYGIMFVEAMLFALDKINNDTNMLYGLKLSVKIFDTCGDKTILRHALARIANWASQGIIGPQYSDDAKTTALVMDIFGKNTISYSATSPDLENRERYKVFYRTIPSDTHSVKLFLSLALKFQWRYIAIISSEGNYGEKATALFRRGAIANEICIPVDIAVPDDATNSDIKYVVDSILKYKSVKVVYLFMTEYHLIKFFEVAETMKNKTGYLNFVVGDGWGSRSFIASNKTVANGSITFQVETKEIQEFREYFIKLKPSTNIRNIWFKRFWEQTFNCKFINDSSRPNICTGKEELRNGIGYNSQTPVMSVINAFYAYANAFRRTIWYECIRENKTAPECVKEGMLQGIKSYRSIQFYLKNVKFQEPYKNRTFTFDSVGDHDENYDILNYYYTANTGKKAKLQQIGIWNNLNQQNLQIKTGLADNKPLNPDQWRLSLNNNTIVWKNQSTQPVSVCSETCNRGYVTNKQSMCCWKCVKCEKNEVTINNTCHSCSLDFIPDVSSTMCTALEVRSIGMHPSTRITIFCLSGGGIFLTLTVVVLFLKNFDTRLVKASSRELCLNMLIGIAMVFLSPLFFILKPTRIACNLQSMVIGISFTTCYAPLLLRTNRIYRIFRSAKTSVTRPMLISPRSQIVMSLALTAIGTLIGLVSIAGKVPEILTAYPSHREFIFRYCKIGKETMILNLLFSSILMIATTWFAFKTRNFPKNYNEAKYIGFTMYTTCIILAVFLPIFFFVDDNEGKYRPLILCSVCFINAVINLIGLFGLKVKVLVMKDCNELDGNVTMMTGTVFNVHRVGASSIESSSPQQTRAHALMNTSPMGKRLSIPQPQQIKN